MNKLEKILLNNIASSSIISSKLRGKIYKIIKLNFNNSEIRSNCYFNSKNVSIGEGSFINRSCQFYSGYKNEYGIFIGKKCFIGMNVNMCCISHGIGNEKQRAGKNIFGSITVGDGTWIGANVTVLPGVTIGKGCVIAAGSVVSKDCLPNSLYAGIPATWIKDLPI